MEMNRTAVLYLRHDDGLPSLAEQRRICREYAEREGLDVITVYEDVGSPEPFENLPGFQRLLNSGKELGARNVVCLSEAVLSDDKHDRLLRRMELKGSFLRLFCVQE